MSPSRIPFEPRACAVCGNASRFTELVVCRDLRIEQDVCAVVCDDCGLVFLNPAPMEAAYLDYYAHAMGADAPPPPAARIVGKKKHLGPLFVQFIEDRCGTLARAEAVDVGAGWGGFLPYLRPRVKSLVATEMFGPAKPYIEREFGCRVHAVPRLHDAFPPGSFDLITATAVVEHYPNPLPALADYREALRPGGIVFLYTHDVKGMSFPNGAHQYFKFVHPFYYSAHSLENLLTRAGFTEIECWASSPVAASGCWSAPAGPAPGVLLCVARKADTPPRAPCPLLRDAPEEILALYRRATLQARRRQRARRIWQSPLAFPWRVLARLAGREQPSRYEAIADQYRRDRRGAGNSF